jgi:uncharacterized protein DUF5829
MFLPCTLLCLAQSSPETLLAPLPAGWRTERLEFPLSFAPTLPYRGYEDLAFAPGMFTLDSDSYFSYALALRLEGDVLVDEAMLTGFLETYYRGLCAAVASEKKLARDASSVHARVWRDQEGFRATVEMFDPFTNGQDIDLELELFTHATPRATELVGLASPLEHELPVWKELHALGEAWRAARPAPVFLNHAFFVVDAETYAALAGNEFLREAFAVNEERTTKRGDLSYSGLYLYGARTYFEFLPPTPAAGLAEGASGLALGLESAGSVDALAQRLVGAKIGIQKGPITRELEGKAVPWFQILGVEMPAAPLSLFAMEYDESFLTGWHAELEPKRAGKERALVLERYAAALGQAERRRTAPLVDVREVRLALDDAQRERVLAVAAAAGWEVEASEGAWTCLAPQLRLRITRARTAGGITGLGLELREPVEREAFELGSFTLRFEGKNAQLERRL